MPPLKIEYGMQLKVVWPALLIFSACAASFSFLSTRVAQQPGTDSFDIYFLYTLTLASLIFALAILYGLLKRFVGGKTFLIFDESHFEIPARVFKPKRNIFYKDITGIGTESIKGTHFIQCHLKDQPLIGITNRLFKSEADFQLAVDTLLKKTNKRFNPF